MANEDHSWRTHGFRQSVVAKIDEAIQQSGMPTSKNSAEMENHVFQKAKTKEEYLGYVARLILHVREMNSKKSGMAGGPNQGGQGMPDPINALQNLASQGSRNNQMMLGSNMGNPMGQQGNMVPQNANNQMQTATNLLQNLNQRPNQGLQGIPNLQNKMPGMGPGNPAMLGNMPMQMGNPSMQMQNMGNMGGMQQMSGQNQTMANMQQLQNQLQGQIGSQLPGQMGGQMMNQMPSQISNANNMGGNNLMANMNQNNPMGGQMNNPNSSINSNIGGSSIVQNNLGGANNMPPNSMNINAIGQNMGGSNVGGMGPNMGGGNMPGQNMGMPNMGQNMGVPNMGPNPMGSGPNMVPMGNMPPQMMAGHMPRKPGDAMMMGNPNMFQGPRQMAPNQFLHQSPSPSAPSPAGMGGPGSQMVASPALVPSPSSQMSHMSQQQRSVGMAPSPSSSLNTPGQAVPTASPLAVQEEQAYREKARQLSKYIDPLRRMIARIGNDDVEKLSKFKKLLEILSNPTQRIPLETLLKCEVVLEKMDLKRSEGGSAPPIHPHLSTLKEHHIFNPLLEAVSNCLQNPTANHTLYRTFGPTMSSLTGPEIKNLPPSTKRSYPDDSPTDISDVLQGEIARLDQRFKVSLDPTHQPGSKSVQLLCCLDDKFLPSVPPVSLYVPEDYPMSSPHCSMAEYEYGATTFLTTVQKALQTRITKLPRRFSISQLLDTWEMSVRQACAPTQVPPSAATVLLGL